MTPSAEVLAERISSVEKRQDRFEKETSEGIQKIDQKLDKLVFWAMTGFAALAAGTAGIIITMLQK